MLFTENSEEKLQHAPMCSECNSEQPIEIATNEKALLKKIQEDLPSMLVVD